MGSKFLCDLTASFNQLAPPWTTVRIIVDGIEDRCQRNRLYDVFEKYLSWLKDANLFDLSKYRT